MSLCEGQEPVQDCNPSDLAIVGEGRVDILSYFFSISSHTTPWLDLNSRPCRRFMVTVSDLRFLKFGLMDLE